MLDELRGPRTGLLLLVLGSPPPVRVKGLGARAIDDALRAGLENIRARDARTPAEHAVGIQVAWITWAEIGDIVTGAVATFSNADADVVDAVRRSVQQLAGAVKFHS